MILRCFLRGAAALAAFLALGVAHADDKARSDDDPIPFTNMMKDNPFDISKLRCADYLDIQRRGRGTMYLILIWAHGVRSGLTGQTAPFAYEWTDSAAKAISLECTGYEQTKLYDAIVSVVRAEKR